MTARTQHHGETESRAAGFDAVLQRLFERAAAHARTLAIVAGVVVVVGVVAALMYESAQRAEAAAQTELMRVEAVFVRAMGGDPGERTIPEPANADQARRARQDALAALDALAVEHAGTQAALAAALRAAEMEVDLGQLQAAAARLAALVQGLDADDPRRGIALALRGYALEEQGVLAEAAAVYQSAAELEAYPDRALLWVRAGETFARAGDYTQALLALQQAVAISPELAQERRLLGRIAALEVLRDRSGS